MILTKSGGFLGPLSTLLGWIMEGKKQFLIIGNINAISYKEVFPLIRDNKIWLGPSITSGDRLFMIPEDLYNESKVGARDVIIEGQHYISVVGVRWYTNLDHGRRHEPIQLMSMADNLKFNKKLKGLQKYIHYENYDAIEVPFVELIPSDYNGTIGVPLSFLDKYCPEQFIIIGQTQGDSGKELGLAPYPRELKKLNKSLRDGQLYYIDEDGIPQKPYARILIRKKQ